MPDAELIVIRDFDSDLFHQKVVEMEGKGYVANRDTYKITAEMDPETGNIVHLHTIEMVKTN